MKNVFFAVIILTLLLASCSSIDFTKQRYVQFKSNESAELFFMSAPQSLKSQGFNIISSNEADGTLRANKVVTDKFRMDILISFDVPNRDVLITIVNKIKTVDGEKIEYYNLEEFNSDYEEYFHSAILALKVNATKTAFPNR